MKETLTVDTILWINTAASTLARKINCWTMTGKRVYPSPPHPSAHKRFFRSSKSGRTNCHCWNNINSYRDSVIGSWRMCDTSPTLKHTHTYTHTHTHTYEWVLLWPWTPWKPWEALVQGSKELPGAPGSPGSPVPYVTLSTHDTMCTIRDTIDCMGVYITRKVSRIRQLLSICYMKYENFVFLTSIFEISFGNWIYIL